MGGRFVVGAIAGVVLAAGLAGCAPAGAGVSASPAPPSPSATPSATPSASPSPSPTVTVDAQPLEVLCDADLVTHVSSETVTATSAGVPLLVSSEAPAGTYLVHNYGGDELPASPETWILTIEPGPLTLGCFKDDVDGPEVTVTIADPGGYFSTTTLAGYGCDRGGLVDWAFGPATGATPEEAVTNLVAGFGEFGTRRELTRWEHADVGYRDAAIQTWVIGSDASPDITAQVMKSGSGYQAFADAICAGGTWPSDA